MKLNLNAALGLAIGTLITAPALAHEPKAVDGGVSAWALHQLTQTDHVVAIVAAVVVGVGLFAHKKAKALIK